MKEIYTLAELKALRNETINAISDIFAETTKNKACTAKEIADATNGLCSPHHIANSVAYSNTYNSNYISTSERRIKTTKKFAELDEDDNIIRKFEVTRIHILKTYKMH